MNRRRVSLVIVLAGAALSAMPAFAQSSPAKEEPKPESREPRPAPKPATGDPLGDLDDLLGLPRTGPRPAPAEGEQAETPAEAPDGAALELERRLTSQEIEDRFRRAVQQMAESADRLAVARDAGVRTQRLHAEILTNLDVLIKQAESQSGSSSSSQQQQQQQSRQNQPSQPQAQRGQQQNEAGEGENRGETDPPGFQPPQLRGQLDLARAAWGSLPERVRDALLQGSSDQFSSLYEALTQEYYRKLAEEANER